MCNLSVFSGEVYCRLLSPLLCSCWRKHQELWSNFCVKPKSFPGFPESSPCLIMSCFFMSFKAHGHNTEKSSPKNKCSFMLYKKSGIAYLSSIGASQNILEKHSPKFNLMILQMFDHETLLAYSSYYYYHMVILRVDCHPCEHFSS